MTQEEVEDVSEKEKTQNGVEDVMEKEIVEL